VVVYGVNPWSRERHVKFRRKFSFPFPLLVDQGQVVAALYNAGGLFIKRTVYLIGPDGIIRYAKRGKPHPDEVLAAAA
jgi:peroxiredoxin Q/BCP